jgi:hypothetical protein
LAEAEEERRAWSEGTSLILIEEEEEVEEETLSEPSSVRRRFLARSSSTGTFQAVWSGSRLPDEGVVFPFRRPGMRGRNEGNETGKKQQAMK